MTKPSKPEDNQKVILPMPPEMADEQEMRIYARFMRHLRCVPNSRMEIKVLSALQFTADLLNSSDGHVAKVMVEHGLRAPRMAFPADFLSYADQALMRDGWEVGGPTTALLALKEHWDRHGDDKFAAFKRDYSLLNEEAVY